MKLVNELGESPATLADAVKLGVIRRDPAGRVSWSVAVSSHRVIVGQFGVRGLDRTSCEFRRDLEMIAITAVTGEAVPFDIRVGEGQREVRREERQRVELVHEQLRLVSPGSLVHERMLPRWSSQLHSPERAKHPIPDEAVDSKVLLHVPVMHEVPISQRFISRVHPREPVIPDMERVMDDIVHEAHESHREKRSNGNRQGNQSHEPENDRKQQEGTESQQERVDGAVLAGASVRIADEITRRVVNQVVRHVRLSQRTRPSLVQSPMNDVPKKGRRRVRCERCDKHPQDHAYTYPHGANIRRKAAT